MAAVAEYTGAPSGSVYYRFPDRPALLAAVWRETTRALETTIAASLGDDPAAETVVQTAVVIVEWCREHPHETSVLLVGKRAFSPDGWSEADTTRQLAAEAERDLLVSAVVRKIADETGRPRDEVAFALLDLPIAVVRRYSLAGRPIPPSAIDLVERIAHSILLA